MVNKLTNVLKSIAVVGALTLTGCASTTQTSSVTSVVEETPETTVETDTAAPVITLSKESVSKTTSTKFSELDVSSNIKSVKDDTDGLLDKVDTLEDGKAGYVIDLSNVKNEDGKLVKGTYNIKVTAQDSAGNKTTETFELKVTKAKSTKKSTNSSKSDSSKSSTSKKSNSSSSSKSASKSNSNSSNSSNKSNSGNASSSKSNNSGSSSSSSSSNNKSNNSSNSSSSSSSATTTTPAQPKQTCSQVWVQDSAAWDEQVKVSDAQYQTVHHDATGHYENVATGSVVVCNGCGQVFGTYNEWVAHDESFMFQGNDDHGSYHTNATYSQQWVQDSAAWDEQVKVSDAQYKTVHHDATGHYETKCN